MTYVEGFSTYDEYLQAMAEREEAANAAVLPFQRDITWGSKAFRYDQQSGLVIFTHVQTIEEMTEIELRLGASEEELQYTLESTKGSHERGYRYGTHYSKWEPTGELGSAHISTMVPIPVYVFDSCKENGWEITIELIEHLSINQIPIHRGLYTRIMQAHQQIMLEQATSRLLPNGDDPEPSGD